jgi:hypothetical protein
LASLALSVLPSAVPAGFPPLDPESLLRKSVAYQPLPLSWNPAAVTCLAIDGRPHAGQSVNGASLIF